MGEIKANRLSSEQCLHLSQQLLTIDNFETLFEHLQIIIDLLSFSITAVGTAVAMLPINLRGLGSNVLLTVTSVQMAV